MEDRGLNSFASNMRKLSVSETKWSSLLARTGAFILYISILIFDFVPEKLPGLSRNRPQDLSVSNPVFTVNFVRVRVINVFLLLFLSF